jgi:hypothetical protein
MRVFDIRDPFHPTEIAYFNGPILPTNASPTYGPASYAMSARPSIPCTRRSGTPTATAASTRCRSPTTPGRCRSRAVRSRSRPASCCSLRCGLPLDGDFLAPLAELGYRDGAGEVFRGLAVVLLRPRFPRATRGTSVGWRAARSRDPNCAAIAVPARSWRVPAGRREPHLVAERAPRGTSEKLVDQLGQLRDWIVFVVRDLGRRRRNVSHCPRRRTGGTRRVLLCA